MLTAIKGYYEKGNIVLIEHPPIENKTEVIVTFLTDIPSNRKKKNRTPGGLKGKVTIIEDFNEPLGDMRDYQ